MTQEQSITKVLIFDIWGEYAHFRKIYTTTSPLTYSIPTRTALCGLIGAILGMRKENNEYLESFALNNAKIGLRLLNPVKKVNIAENLIHTKDAKGIGMNLIITRAQIRFEFLKDPMFRIYFWHKDETIYAKLKNYLGSHKTTYTLCLGLSENIANYKYVGEFNAEILNIKNQYIPIHSVIPVEKINKDGINISILRREYFKEIMPIEMNINRVVKKYENILYERQGKPIEVKLINHYYKINNNDEIENIVFIE